MGNSIENMLRKVIDARAREIVDEEIALAISRVECRRGELASAAAAVLRSVRLESTSEFEVRVKFSDAGSKERR